MEKLINILEEIKPDVDYKNCQDLVDGHHLDSLSILALISEIEEEFDITIPTIEIVPENFNSIERINALIERLEDE